MAFIVEDGSVVPDSNAYCSLEYAKDYFDTFGYVYSNYSDIQIQQALIRATNTITLMFSSLFSGYRKLSAQSLDFPRELCVDNQTNFINFYNYIANNVVPTEVKQSVCVLALKILSKMSSNVNSPFIDDISPTFKRERIEGAIDIEYFEHAKKTKEYPEVYCLLSRYFKDEKAGQLKIVRG